MPYPNEHSARLVDPEKYDSFARMNDKFGDGIHAVFGIIGEGDDKKSELQAIRFDKDTFTVDEAKAWLKEKDYKVILFEPAEEKKAETFNCECIECGHKIESEKHCKDIKCPECGGTMRREERPGPGEDVKNIKRAQYSAEVGDIDLKERTLVTKISTDAVDRAGEILLPKGANLKNYRKNPVVQWAHDYEGLPVAKSLWEKVVGNTLVSKLKFATHTLAENVWQLYVGGFLKAFSVGFLPEAGQIHAVGEKDLVKHPEWKGAHTVYKKWELLEFSAVPVPCNPDALALAVRKGLVRVPEGIPLPEVKGVNEWKEADDMDAHRAVLCDVDKLKGFYWKASGEIGGRKYIIVRGVDKETNLDVDYLHFYEAKTWNLVVAKKHAELCGAVDFVNAGPKVKVLEPIRVSPPVQKVTVLKRPKPQAPTVKVVGDMRQIKSDVTSRLRGRVTINA